SERCGSLSVLLVKGLFFFFQAEDGIRDFHVTGVQTCALPISLIWCARCWKGSPSPCANAWTRCRSWPARCRWCAPAAGPASPPRSEERRVGKDRRASSIAIQNTDYTHVTRVALITM